LWFFLAVAAGVAVAQSSPSESERAAYDVAVHRKAVKKRIEGLKFFLKTFPNSTLKERTLEGLADAFNQSGNVQEEQDTLEQLLTVNADNLRGLTLRAYAMLLGCDSGGCEQEQMSLADHGFRVLGSATKPDYLSDEEFDRQKAQAAILFHHLAGIAALGLHDYRTAQEHWNFVVEADPNNFSYVYPLALTYLNSKPPDMSRALFFLARAATLSPASARPQIETFGRGQYEKYHGSAEGWTNVLGMAKTNPLMPPSLTIARAPQSD
jgi:hypothetical protein